MSDLTVFESIKNELTIKNDGVGYCSLRGASKLVGISHSVLVEHFKDTFSMSEKISKLSKRLIEQGFEPGYFSSKGIPDLALAIIIEYYALDAGRRCTTLAKNAYRAFAAVGIRTVVQKVVNQSNTQNSIPSLERVERWVELRMLDISNPNIQSLIQARCLKNLSINPETIINSGTTQKVVGLRPSQEKEPPKIELDYDTLRLLEKDNLITQENFASSIGISRTTLWRWEKHIVHTSRIASVYCAFSNRQFLNQFQQEILLKIKNYKSLGYTNSQVSELLDSEYEILVCDFVKDV